MRKEEFKKCSKIIEQHFRNITKEQQKFVPGKSRIPLAIPPYGSKEVIESLESLLSMKTTAGTKVRKFEKKFSNYIGGKYGIMVNSGSSANLLALSILSNPLLKNRIKPGDEIITPAVTWATTVYPICNINAIPRIVDVNLCDYTIDPDSIEKAINKKTKAIMIVHLLGNPCNMKAIVKIAKKHKLWLIEDACEAHGAKFSGKHVGTFGDLATFSFFASHHITTMEGGMITTNNKMLNEIGKSMRTFGWSRDLSSKKQLEKKFSNIDSRFLFVNTGFNFRPTELQGAFGIHQIDKLEKLVKLRITNAEYWNKKLKRFSNLLLTKKDVGRRKSYLFYPITVKKNKFFKKKDLVNELEKHGIETRSVMTGNITKQPVAKILKFKKSGDLKNSDYIHENSFVIGNHHEIGEKQRKFVTDVITNFIDKKQKQ
jgi:CDP-6-deoxy-D-xylo-4-hexulose-3-dehydrase|tara:strand:+ start:261 stop:1544 length:1284 start_codon:yes stop_codon:yes gene_type:complete